MKENVTNIAFLFTDDDESKEAIDLMNYYKYHYWFKGEKGIWYGWRSCMMMDSYKELPKGLTEIKPVDMINILKPKIKNAENNRILKKYFGNQMSKL